MTDIINYSKGSLSHEAAQLAGWFIIQKLIFDTVCMYAKYDDSSFSRSRDIIGASKFKVGHVTLTMPLLRVICHQNAET